jgi:hypothetical protein
VIEFGGRVGGFGGFEWFDLKEEVMKGRRCGEVLVVVGWWLNEKRGLLETRGFKSS